MIPIAIEFVAGRYHATPWGRNVNEGVSEWPPSSYRLARALIDIWKRQKGEWPEARILPILEAFSRPPSYLLPPAIATHLRYYQPINDKDPMARRRIFDPFMALDRNEPVLMGLDADLSDDSLQDLKQLLARLNYLGRSESWIRASLADPEKPIEWNCRPMNGKGRIGEAVRLACIRPPEAYDALPQKPKGASWLDALSMNTASLLSQGWSDPPALVWLDYEKPETETILSGRQIPFRSGFRCARYAISAKVKPRIQDTVSVAERVRSYLMGIHKRIRNHDPEAVSPRFSGKAPDGSPLSDHRHAFYLPLDEDHDGRIDHILVQAEDPFSPDELAALDGLKKIHQRKNSEGLDLVLVSLSAEKPVQQARKWISATPFVTARHHRKGRGTYGEWIVSEVIRECSFHGLQQPEAIEPVSHTRKTAHPIRWMEFLRSRKGGSPRQGHGFILHFKEPVSGPFAIGAGCHFGLGIFVPLN